MSQTVRIVMFNCLGIYKVLFIKKYNYYYKKWVLKAFNNYRK